MATKKEFLAQEIAKAVGAGKAVAMETVDFSDPNRPKTCLYRNPGTVYPFHIHRGSRFPSLYPDFPEHIIPPVHPVMILIIPANVYTIVS